jgi:amino acid transporter/signal transduction histidine kinase
MDTTANLSDARQSYPPHPRTIGWLGTSALAMGGSNQMLFLIGALIAGQGDIPGQGSAAVVCLIVGLALSWMAAPGWIELVLMWPNRVGGIAATCGEAFGPYAPVLGNLTGIAYWWGWVPTCGICALLSAGAIQSWFLPHISVPIIASAIVLFFLGVNLTGVKWVTRMTIPLAILSATLAFLSAIIPVVSGHVDWHQAFSFHLDTPFPGMFGKVTSFMAGLYLVGFAAPAFEAAACHVGETVNPEKNVPRAIYASAGMATLYFLVLPLIWLGTIGTDGLSGDLATTLGPVFAPLAGGAARAAAAAFMVFNMFHGTIAPLTGVCRTLSQLAEDGLLPEFFARRTKRTDVPWVASSVTAALAIGGIWINDPVWLIAAANLTYLIGIAMPSVAVWLLRRDQPDLHRPYRAPRGTIMAGLIAAIIWGVSTVLGFEQFGLPTVIFGICLAYSGSVLYAWRKWSDHRKEGSKGVPHSLHVKLTGAMMLVLLLDGGGYLLAVQSAGAHGTARITALEDIFVAVALLTITVGLILPGMIAHSAVEVMNAAKRLATGTLSDFSHAMEALAAGNLDDAHARVDIRPVRVHTKDEVGQMASSFNTMQEEVKRAAVGLDGAREGLRKARLALEESNANLEQRVEDRTAELKVAHARLVDTARQAGMAEIAIGVLHNVGNVLNSVNVSANTVNGRIKKSKAPGLTKIVAMLKEHEADLGQFMERDGKGKELLAYLDTLSKSVSLEQRDVLSELESLAKNVEHIKQIVNTQQSYATAAVLTDTLDLRELAEDALRVSASALQKHQIDIDRNYGNAGMVLGDKHKVLQILINLIGNAQQAMVDAPTRRLSIGLANSATGAVQLTIQDTGCGIPAENLTRIFNHGFTTKPDGHGFGLHASVLAAGEMKGCLTASSDGPGKGALFTLTMPAAVARAVAA